MQNLAGQLRRIHKNRYGCSELRIADSACEPALALIYKGKIMLMVSAVNVIRP